jgi:hypothetical protein
MIPDLELPEDLDIPTCTNCGEEWVDEEAAKKIDAAAERAYKQALLSKAERAIAAIKGTGVAQRDLERLLGLSAGYLSKLRAGERDTSAHLVAALMLLAKDPARVVDLREGWSMQGAAAIQCAVVPKPITFATLMNQTSSARGGSVVDLGAQRRYREYRAAFEPQSRTETVTAQQLVG